MLLEYLLQKSRLVLCLITEKLIIHLIGGIVTPKIMTLLTCDYSGPQIPGTSETISCQLNYYNFV